MKNQTVLEQVFVSMRYGRKYSAGFIASRQKLNIGAVRQALRTLDGEGMLEKQPSSSNKRFKLYTSKQRELKLINE